MQLSTIARVMPCAALLLACGTGGGGPVEGSIDPGGPFSGIGKPGSSIYDKPGPFSGYGTPGPVGPTDVSGLFATVCQRLRTMCPATNSDLDACMTRLQSEWNKLTSDCARSLVYAFWTCVLVDNITCNERGEANLQSCAPPSFAQCGGTTGTGGAGGAGTGTGGAGGTGEGGTSGVGGAGGSGGSTGGTGGSGSGGTGATGGTGGTGGGTGGTGGGTGGRGGRAGGGGTTRDAGRG